MSFTLQKRNLVNRFMTPILGVALLATAPMIQAKTTYLGTWSGLYPASSSDSNASCALCHTTVSTSGALNPYGSDINSSLAGAISARIIDVEGEDSDSDPTSSDNIAEINANAQPGWTGTAPTGVSGDLDPAGNQAPIADANGPYFGTEGLLVLFDGSDSTDLDGTITAYDWTFGDGNTGTGMNPTYTYNTAGTYDVSLVVTDDADAQSAPSTTTASIEPAPQDPVADPNGPYTGIVDQAVAFDGSGSFDPDGGNITQYDWDFGDGNTGIGVNPSHTYATANTYTVTLTVVDDEGAISAQASTTADISSDQDADGIADNADNCILDANGPLIPDAGGNIQRDTDGDGFGNVCDPDFNGDLVVNAEDLAYMKTTFFTSDPDADLDGEGTVNAGDLAILKTRFFSSPGPSGLVP